MQIIIRQIFVFITVRVTKRVCSKGVSIYYIYDISVLSADYRSLRPTEWRIIVQNYYQ